MVYFVMLLLSPPHRPRSDVTATVTVLGGSTPAGQGQRSCRGTGYTGPTTSHTTPRTHTHTYTHFTYRRSTHTHTDAPHIRYCTCKHVQKTPAGQSVSRAALRRRCEACTACTACTALHPVAPCVLTTTVAAGSYQWYARPKTLPLAAIHAATAPAATAPAAAVAVACTDCCSSGAALGCTVDAPMAVTTTNAFHSAA